MVKVITYGTYDHLHRGHIRLLERAKALGDYLIVGVTSDDFDKQRGKINVQQPLEERIAAVRATGIADKIIVEEYEGQKIDDIKRYGVDIFTVGSDWRGTSITFPSFAKSPTSNAPRVFRAPRSVVQKSLMLVWLATRPT